MSRLTDLGRLGAHPAARALWHAARRPRRLYQEFAAHYTWHLTQPDTYFRYSAECPNDFIRCPWCHREYRC